MLGLGSVVSRRPLRYRWQRSLCLQAHVAWYSSMRDEKQLPAPCRCRPHGACQCGFAIMSGMTNFQTIGRAAPSVTLAALTQVHWHGPAAHHCSSAMAASGNASSKKATSGPSGSTGSASRAVSAYCTQIDSADRLNLIAVNNFLKQNGTLSH